MTDEIKELKSIIQASERIVFFGGAGVSTGSGIPDFRGSGGLYSSEYDGIAPETILSRDYMTLNREYFFDYYKNNMVYPEAKPNGAHYALAELEKMGKLTAVVTQNIDGLHQVAGSETVYELHGSVRRNYCEHCGREFSLDYVLECDSAPTCDFCSAYVRPDVVLYGESLPTDAYYAAEQAIAEADTLIVGGTSLTVYPAAYLISEFRGKHFVIINKTPTPLDGEATLIIREPIERALMGAIH